MAEIIVAFIGLFGVTLGWCLNLFTDMRKSRPKLFFQMSLVPSDEQIDKELRTKTSDSDYSIEVYNLGEKPFVLESFEITYKKFYNLKEKMAIYCSIPKEECVILPYHSVEHILKEEDADTLLYFCKLFHFDKCRIVAYGIDGKKAKGDLDVLFIKTRASI